MAVQGSGSGRTVYADYIREQLVAQEARKASLEQRGLSIVSTSGALVTLLFGLAALTVERDDFALPTAASVLLVIALLVFVAAGVSAIVTNIPLSYQGVTGEALRTAVAERWDDTDAEATRMTSLTRIKVLESARQRNNMKGVALFVGMALELVAVALVGAAVAVILFA